MRIAAPVVCAILALAGSAAPTVDSEQASNMIQVSPIPAFIIESSRQEGKAIAAVF